MRLVTVATHSERYFPVLQESCKRYNSKLDVLGWGEKWQGFGWRFQLVKDFIVDLDDNEVVCFIDGYDVLLLRPIEEMELKFKFLFPPTKSKIVIAHDDIQGLFMTLCSEIAFYKNVNVFREKRMNAGTYMGYVKDVKRMFDELKVKSDDDDQMLLINYAKQNKDLFEIDIDKDFFLTTGNAFFDFINKNMKIVRYYSDGSKQLFYKDKRPFIAHGPSMTNMNNLMEQLDYVNVPKYDYMKMVWTGLEKIYYYTPYILPVYAIIAIPVYYLLF
jgi:hypothetical protein